MVDWRGEHLIFMCTSSQKVSSLQNLFSVVVFHRSMVNWRRGGQNLFGVVVFHRSMVDWRRGDILS